MSDSIRTRLTHIGATLAFIFISAVLAMTASERVYWYWGFADGPPADVVLGTIEGALFYSVPMAAALWVMAKTPARQIHQLVLASAVFAFIVEGVLTAVIFEAGPLDPIFPAMFIGWHGILAMVGFWYLTRRWLLERRRWLLLTAATVMGVAWGLWTTNSWLPENLTDVEPDMVKTIADPASFALYAAWVGAVFILGHWLLGRAWQPKFNPGRLGTAALAVVLIGLHFIIVLAVPWAPIKLAAMLGIVGWALVRSRRRFEGPTILEQLDGGVRWRDAALIAVMPIAAAATYATAWTGDLSNGVIEIIFLTMVFLQVAAGASFFTWAVARSFRSRPPRNRDKPTIQDSGPGSAESVIPA